MSINTGGAPIGVFDSGIGGLSVLRHIKSEIPEEPIVYLADQVHIPYGPRPLQQIRTFSKGISSFLINGGAKIVVVACNTASAAALQYLRNIFPGTPFVGMEPAVKPAAENTRSGVVGVLATPATFQGALYASVVERFAKGVVLLQDTCPGLVEQIERGNIDGSETRMILLRALEPMLRRGIDTIVLGCTHYPFVIPIIESICGPGVRVIDPAPAVARQVRRVLEVTGMKLPAGNPVPAAYYTSGDLTAFANMLSRLTGETTIPAGVVWDSGEDAIRPI